MLKNRVYLGERVYNQRSYKAYRRGEHGSLFNPLSDWIKKENAHPAIIERSLFDSVQSKFTTRSNDGNNKTRGIGQGRTYGPYLLTGLAHCGRCDYSINGMNKIGNGHKYRAYVCGSYFRLGKDFCGSFTVRASELEGLALQAIRDEITSPTWKDEVKPILSGLVRDRFGEGSKGEIEAVKNRLKKLGREIQNIVAAISQGHYSPTLGLELERLEREKASIAQELADMEALPTIQSEIDGMVSEIMMLSGELDAAWNNCETTEDKKEFLKSFIHRVTINPGAMSAAFHVYKLPHLETKWAGSPPLQASDPFLIKLVAGVGFEPTTSRL